MAESDIRTVRMPLRPTSGAALASGCTWLMGKPTPTAGALSAPRSGSDAATSAVLSDSSAVSAGGLILHQEGSHDDLSWSGSRYACPWEATPLRA